MLRSILSTTQRAPCRSGGTRDRMSSRYFLPTAAMRAASTCADHSNGAVLAKQLAGPVPAGGTRQARANAPSMGGVGLRYPWQICIQRPRQCMTQQGRQAACLARRVLQHGQQLWQQRRQRGVFASTPRLQHRNGRGRQVAGGGVRGPCSVRKVRRADGMHAAAGTAEGDAVQLPRWLHVTLWMLEPARCNAGRKAWAASSKAGIEHRWAAASERRMHPAEDGGEAGTCLRVAGQDLLDERAAAAWHADHKDGAKARVPVAARAAHQRCVKGVCRVAGASLGRLRRARRAAG